MGLFTGLSTGGFGQTTQPVWSGATVRWNLNRETDVVAYRVYCGPERGRYLTALPVGNTNSARIEGLLTGSTNYFMVTAVNRRGVESRPSLEVACLIKPPPTGSAGTVVSNPWAPYPVIRLASDQAGPEPATGLGFTAIELGSGAITVRWQGAPGVVLERSNHLDAFDWTMIPGTDGKGVHEETLGQAASFYRLARRRPVTVE